MTDRVFTVATEQYKEMEARLDDTTLPRSFTKDGEFVTSLPKWWCSGFYPGTLWYIYEYTGDSEILAQAEKNTLKLDSIKFVTHDHDVGFQINCSYGNGLRLTGNKAYADVLRTAAHSLATRFNPNAGTTKSWDFVHKGRDWQHPVIIDNMMNLELFLSVADMFGEDDLREIACTHANTTMKNHFRPDFTSYHLVDYDAETGEVRTKHTVQGYADDSAWARGQAWGLYAYAMMFRFTQQESYLTQAQKIADMLLERLPEDGIPYWDFNAPNIPNELRDASAAAIIASGLIELSTFTRDAESSAKYLAMAEKQLRELASPAYLAEVGDNGNFLLKHSVGSLPGNVEVDVPLTYADYYFVEALLRYKNLNK